MHARVICFWLTLFLLISGNGKALASGCDPEEMPPGKTAEEVASRCGEPNWLERWSEERPVEIAPRLFRREVVTFEEWVYDFGPSKFIRILRFQNGLLSEVKTGGYGFSSEMPTDFGCERTIVSPGETKWEVRIKCGEPTSARGESTRKEASPSDRSWQKDDAWIYNLGSTRLIRIFRFQNGRLAQVETGDYGD